MLNDIDVYELEKDIDDGIEEFNNFVKIFIYNLPSQIVDLSISISVLSIILLYVS